MIHKKIVETPFLPMILHSDGKHLIYANFIYGEREEIQQQDDAILLEAKRQLAEYFTGTRTDFDLPLKFSGTPFQEKVWSTLAEIPYGKVFTYKEVAEKAGSSKAYRAAGGACRANPFAVIIPCHRVLGSNGKSTGYAGDNVFMKENLLRLEGFGE